MCNLCNEAIDDPENGIITVVYGKHGHQESYHWDPKGDTYDSCFEKYVLDVASSIPETVRR